jgi:hypothetical protein
MAEAGGSDPPATGISSRERIRPMKSSVLPLLFGFIFLGGAAPATAPHGRDAHGSGAVAASPRQAPQPHLARPRLLRTADEVAAPQGIEPLPVYVIEADDARSIALPI